MNELLFAIIIIITILVVECLSRLFGKRGLLFSIVILDMLSLIFSFKITEIFKLTINLGILPFIATLTAVYIYTLKCNPKDIKKIENICLCTNITIAILLVIMNYMVPAITETISINVQGVFERNYKILILFPFIMYLSQYLTVKLYTFVNQLQPNISMCIILTYIITALIYTLIFYLLGYIKVLSVQNSLYIGVSTYIVGLILTTINVIYINIFIKNKKVLK